MCIRDRDYPNIAKEVAKAIQSKECETGILICRSGLGMSIVANKFKGIPVSYTHLNITLECTECKRRNYMTSKNKRNNTDRLEIVKYCKFCKKRTTHKETK